MAHRELVQKVRPNRTDERLLIEAAQRDRARFADIYEEYFEIVYAYVARRVRNRSTAEDLTGEVFHKALANLPRFKWTGAPFAAWLFRIASNLIADRAKRAAREGNVAVRESLEMERGRSPRVSKSADLASYQQANLEEIERQAKLFRLVEELAEDQRRVVVMRFAE